MSNEFQPIDGGFRVDFPGPFSYHDVVVNGRAVPYLTATPLDRGEVSLTLDKRIGVTLTAQEAEKLLPFIADAIAVAAGFTCHPDAEGEEPTQRLPFPRVQAIAYGDPS